MISSKAVFWFSNGSYNGIDDIRRAFEETWSSIKEEEYSISNLEWIYATNDCAAFMYNFTSKGIINGKYAETTGRGTDILVLEDSRWKIVHEHLSIEDQGQD